MGGMAVSAPSPTAQVGKKAIPFQFVDLDGRPVRLADFQGKWVLVNFWAYWCPICRIGVPTLNALNKRDDLVVIGVSLDYGDDVATLREAVDQHGLVKTDTVDMPKYVDLGVGVVPVVNLEWIQKIHRDAAERGYSAEVIVDTILRRMPDYVNYVTPQFSRTDINFQRVPTVDTSNPFIARDIPTPDESMVVIRFADPKGVDFPYLLNMIPNSFMSRRNNIVVPGGKMGFAMELILEPKIHDLVAGAKK